MKNQTYITEVILLGLTDIPELQSVIFILLFLTYVFSITGNLTIITLTPLDSHLQTPMYFFLCNFSFLEIAFTATFTPGLLFSISAGSRGISWEQGHQRCRLLHAVFLCHIPGGHRVLPSGCHVL